MRNKSFKKIERFIPKNWKIKLRENTKIKTNGCGEMVNALVLGPSNFCFESSSLSIRNSIF